MARALEPELAKLWVMVARALRHDGTHAVVALAVVALCARWGARRANKSAALDGFVRETVDYSRAQNALSRLARPQSVGELARLRRDKSSRPLSPVDLVRVSAERVRADRLRRVRSVGGRLQEYTGTYARTLLRRSRSREEQLQKLRRQSPSDSSLCSE